MGFRIEGEMSDVEFREFLLFEEQMVSELPLELQRKFGEFKSHQEHVGPLSIEDVATEGPVTLISAELSLVLKGRPEDRELLTRAREIVAEALFVNAGWNQKHSQMPGGEIPQGVQTGAKDASALALRIRRSVGSVVAR